MTAADFQAEFENEQARENIVTLYRAYRDVTLWGALEGNFNFESDHAAYKALVTGDPEGMKTLTKDRVLEVGVVPGFREGTDSRRRQARDLMDEEWERQGRGKTAPVV